MVFMSIDMQCNLVRLDVNRIKLLLGLSLFYHVLRNAFSLFF